MKRLLYIFPAIALGRFIPGAGFWGPLLLLVGLIFLHELGHFLAAKSMGMPVDVFSLGFGPRLAGFKWRETDVRLSLLPLGGYVRLAGYNPEEPDAEDPYGFLKQPAWRRMIFYSGGILANIATTLVLLFILGVDQARVTAVHAQASPLLVTETVAGAPAAQAGLKAGDRIRSLGELAFPSATNEEAVAYIQARPGQPIPFTLDREGREERLQITPRSEGGIGRVGIQFQPTRYTYERRGFQFMDLGKGAVFATVRTGQMAANVASGLARLVTFRVSASEVGGPITILRAGSRAAKDGWVDFIFLTALISMHLALLNALPIPFLDGGHMALLAFEKVRGKDLSTLLKERIMTGGFFLMATLMAAVLALDIFRLRH